MVPGPVLNDTKHLYLFFCIWVSKQYWYSFKVKYSRSNYTSIHLNSFHFLKKHTNRCTLVYMYTKQLYAGCDRDGAPSSYSTQSWLELPCAPLGRRSTGTNCTVRTDLQESQSFTVPYLLARSSGTVHLKVRRWHSLSFSVHHFRSIPPVQLCVVLKTPALPKLKLSFLPSRVPVPF
jgi:hypothetical protein